MLVQTECVVSHGCSVILMHHSTCESNNTISYVPHKYYSQRVSSLELPERLRSRLVLRHPQDVEPHSLRQRPALSYSDDVADLDTEGW